MSFLQQDGAERPSRSAHILHLEDNANDRELVKLLLDDAGIENDISTVETRNDFERSLADGDWDLILSDFGLPAFDGFQALEMAAKTCPNTPFIFVTGTLGEDTAVESLKIGATDYVLKQRMTRLATSVRRALKEREERLRRERAERELRKSEDQLRFLAYHDALTDLPNRALLLDRLAQALAGAHRNKGRFAVLYIDLDRFKNINDSLGHSAGDIVLQQVAERMRGCARENDTVARLGGDEFVVVLSTVRDGTDAAVAADRIQRAMEEEFQVQGIRMSISCSIGIGVFPEDGEDGESLLKNADIALYSAKERGRSRWQFFTREMNGRAQERLKLEDNVRQALGKNELFLEYQPQLDLSTGKIVGAEALLRWWHPEYGTVPPSTFLPVAENVGVIIPIGEWVLRTACAQAKQWQQDGLGPLVMAVNVSAGQFRHEPLAEAIQRALDDSGLAPKYLELELTEGILLSNEEAMKPLLQQLTSMGLGLAIDNFGKGYCSLNYLRRFPFSKLKIDQSFVRAVSHDARDAALTAAIIRMGKALQMRVIAECVENEEQAEVLRSLGCDLVQGYHFCRPLEARGFARMFQSHRLWRHDPLPIVAPRQHETIRQASSPPL
jgi:diguanylate cyclase (GGDEF)-like protein